MNKKLIVLMLMSIFVAPVMAEKPEWAGKGKPSEEQKAAHKAAMEAKEDIDDHASVDGNDDIDEQKDKIKKQKKGKSKELKGLEKQRATKPEQVQKELDKGSEKGKVAREENSKKWWKFWGE